MPHSLYSPHPFGSRGGLEVSRNGNGDAQFRGSDLAPELLALGSALAGRAKETSFATFPTKHGNGQPKVVFFLNAIEFLEGIVDG